MASTNTSEQHEAEAFNNLFEISKCLNSGIDKETLQILVDLVELGVNPEALATVVKEIRKEAAVIDATRGETPWTQARAVFLVSARETFTHGLGYDPTHNVAQEKILRNTNIIYKV